MKHVELFKNGFDETVSDKIRPENYPYVGYDMKSGEIVYTLIPEENQSGYQMIDLGLSVKWADRNVGAETPQDNGLYFSWGNTDGHVVDEASNTVDGYLFNLDTYSTTSGGQYTGSTLDTTHDAASINMGSDWRIPTIDEITELIENTDHYYIDLMGHMVPESQLNSSSKLRSICFVKKDDDFNYDNRSNFIEIPFAGFCVNSTLAFDGTYSIIWSNSVKELNTNNIYAMFCTNNGDLSDYYGTINYYGHSVRGVHV